MSILSHYTSRTGLEGIASSGAFWATNFLQVNDKSEFFYSLRKLQREAFQYVYDRIPQDLRQENVDIDNVIELWIKQIRSEMLSGESYGQLFVTSFAQSNVDDEIKRGILTLWDRYTNLEGYCLQFERSKIEHMIHLDAMKSSYEWLDAKPVNYALNNSTLEFKKIVRQLGEAQLLEIVKQTRDGRINVDYQNHWAPSYLWRKIMQFCGLHKDPAFIDEREFRIIAYPHHKSNFQFLTGLTSPKEIMKSSADKKYIIIGNNWHPSISPSRIIIGPKADPNIGHIARQFHRMPEICLCDIPIS